MAKRVPLRRLKSISHLGFPLLAIRTLSCYQTTIFDLHVLPISTRNVSYLPTDSNDSRRHRLRACVRNESCNSLAAICKSYPHYRNQCSILIADECVSYHVPDNCLPRRSEPLGKLIKHVFSMSMIEIQKMIRTLY